MAGCAKIRVLQVINSYTLGGAEKLVYDLVERMDKAKFEVYVCSIGSRQDQLERKLRTRLQDGGVTTLSLEKPPRRRRLQAVWDLRRLIRSYQIAVVHTHCPSPDFYGKIAAFLAGCPTIVSTLHGSADYSPVSTKLLNPITNAYLAISQQVVNYAVQHLQLPAAKIDLVYNGIDLEAYQKGAGQTGLLRELGIAPQQRVVTCIGRIIEQKGHKFLLEAVAAVLNKYPQIHLLLVGDELVAPHLARQLRIMVQQLGIADKVTFAGVRLDVPDILAVSEVFVLPSVCEGFGLAAVEAMAAGVPVIAAEVGVLPEIIIPGQNGWLIPPGDSQSLAAALEQVLADQEQAEQIGLSGQKTVTGLFGLTSMVSRYEDIYLRQAELAAKRSLQYGSTT